MVTILSIAAYEGTEAIKTSSERRLMFIGDFTILLVSYCFFTFNILEVETNFMIGYVPIGMIGIYICEFIILGLQGRILKDVSIWYITGY